jgi:hypothetical protein
MSDTPAQPHFTVEDAGSTTDPADLANHGVGHAVPRDEDPVESADEVVRATDGVSEQSLAGDDAVSANTSTMTVEEFAVDSEGTAEPVRPSSGQEPTPEPAGAAPQSAPTPARRPDLSALADADIGHVFDQTNGVIERADGDSDGSAESDLFSESERYEDDPTVVDAGVHGDGEVPETRRTGD